MKERRGPSLGHSPSTQDDTLREESKKPTCDKILSFAPRGAKPQFQASWLLFRFCEISTLVAATPHPGDDNILRAALLGSVLVTCCSSWERTWKRTWLAGWWHGRRHH